MRRSGRDLVVVQRGEDVLRVAAVDAVAVLVEHVDVEEVGPRVHLAMTPGGSGSTHHLALTVRHRHIGPDLVGINRALGERMPQFEGPDHRLDEVGLARLESGQGGAQRCDERRINGATLLDAEEVHANAVLQEILLATNGFLLLGPGGQHLGWHTGIGSRKCMAVDGEEVIGAVFLGPEIRRGLERHVAFGAIGLGLVGIIERPRIHARYAREQVRIVVVLAAQELLVVVHRVGDAHLVAGGAKLGCLVEGLQEGLLVELRLALHQLLVDEIGQRVGGREGEGVVHRFFDGVVAVADGALVGAFQVRDGVTRHAGDARLRGRVVHHVEIGIIEGPGEERHRVMAAGAPAGSLHRSVAFQGRLAGLADAEQVEGVVERAELVRRVDVRVEDVLVALQTVFVVHQRLGRDELAVGRPGAAGHEVLLARSRRLGRPNARIVPVEGHEDHHRRGDGRAPGDSHLPANAWPGQPVQQIKPDAEQRRDDVSPIRHGPTALTLDLNPLEAIEAHQHHARDQHHQTDGEERIADIHRLSVGPVPGVGDVDPIEDQEGHHEEQPQDEVGQELNLVGVVLVAHPAGPVFPGHEGDGEQVHRIGPQERQEHPNGVQDPAKPRADGADVALRCG